MLLTLAARTRPAAGSDERRLYSQAIYTLDMFQYFHIFVLLSFQFWLSYFLQNTKTLKLAFWHYGVLKVKIDKTKREAKTFEDRWGCVKFSRPPARETAHESDEFMVLIEASFECRTPHLKRGVCKTRKNRPGTYPNTPELAEHSGKPPEHRRTPLEHPGKYLEHSRNNPKYPRTYREHFRNNAEHR